MKTMGLFFIALLFVLNARAQDRIPLAGETAPSFTANTTIGELTFPEDFGKNWKILFSHPRDFTPVCTSEVLQLARMQKEFESLGVKFAVISTDDVSQHLKWKKSIEEIRQEGFDPVTINFPLIDDSQVIASRLYGMINEKENSGDSEDSWLYGLRKSENGSADVKTSRGVFIIDPDNIIKAYFFYPMNVGRNFEEIKRTVNALQTATNHVLIPANWQPGFDVLRRASPYLDPVLNKKDDLSKKYYNVGTVMWYERMNIQ